MHCVTNVWSYLCSPYDRLFDVTGWIQNINRLIKWMEREHKFLLYGVIPLFVCSERNPRKTSIKTWSISITKFDHKIIRYQLAIRKMIFLVFKTDTQKIYCSDSNLSDVLSPRFSTSLGLVKIFITDCIGLWWSITGRLYTVSWKWHDVANLLLAYFPWKDQKSWPSMRKTGKLLKDAA